GAASLQPESAAVSESLEVHGFLRGHGREWQRPDGGRVQALVYEFGSGEAAAAFDVDSAQLSCAYADDAFTVAGFPDALGLRVRTSGGVRDQVSFLQGARRYEIRVEQAASDSYAAISALTEAAVRAAR
ncbi:MAG TPA: hypothetical protein VML96_00710, partial [Egibacteraceae bacterium]|nr:hypothetical protein [Egibacteraceae bacterium]